jgi:hypothetical protein
MGNFRASIRIIIVEDWAQLMDLMLRPDDYEVMRPKKIWVEMFKILHLAVYLAPCLK